ncbi:hypothetical protein AOLI_G00163870 [Acnodon oligacanthus]
MRETSQRVQHDRILSYSRDNQMGELLALRPEHSSFNQGRYFAPGLSAGLREGAATDPASAFPTWMPLTDETPTSSSAELQPLSPSPPPL